MNPSLPALFLSWKFAEVKKGLNSGGEALGITMSEHRHIGPMTEKYPPVEKIDSTYEEVTQSYKFKQATNVIFELLINLLVGAFPSNQRLSPITRLSLREGQK